MQTQKEHINNDKKPMKIREVFETFLKEQKNRLSKKTYKQHEDVIRLFSHSLDGYAWNTLEDCDISYKKAKEKNLEFIDIYDQSHILPNVGEFIDYFIPRKCYFGYGDEFCFKIAPRVVRKLLKWMKNKAMINISKEEIKEYSQNQPWEKSLEEMGFIKGIDF